VFFPRVFPACFSRVFFPRVFPAWFSRVFFGCVRVGCWSHGARAEMLEATAAELESCKAEILIKTSDLQALGAALSQAEEQFAAVSATAAEAEAAASQAIAILEVPPASARL
jgi:hypothetical protein